MLKVWNQKKHDLPWYHFFDYSHAVRNIWHAFCCRTLYLPESDVSIGAKQLLEVRRAYNDILGEDVLPSSVYAPADAMNMQDCRKLFDKEIATKLSDISK